MSIAVLNQVFDESRRLAVAGSVVARGDFRLKKLLPPLEQAGAKAPVFAKVAECAKAVIEGPEDKSAENLLELTSLVSAVLYTQGETGLAGKLEPIESIDLGGAAVQTSARLLKPLLEALTSTGSGRLELVKDAHERGAFRDLRLIKPALAGLDDPYPEIAEFLAEKVLPMFGKAMLPELRAKYDPKGTKGHPRRLKLMHAVDPASTRELVKQALESGSKEVKVAAIACLGAEKEDLSFLIEQASAKAQDVREAAYRALSTIDEPEAVAVLNKAITGKDLELAAHAIEPGKSEKLSALLVAEVERGVAELPKLKDKKKIGEQARRLVFLMRILPATDHPASDKLTLDLFAKRAELDKVKGDTFSGSDVVEAILARMARGSKTIQATLARAHAELDTDELHVAYGAAEQSLSPAELYEQFSPYITAKVDAKKKGKDPSKVQRDAIIHAICGYRSYWYHFYNSERHDYDPRWSELAVQLKNVGMVHSVAKPDNPAVEAFLRAEFDAAIKAAKESEKVQELVVVMTRLKHPFAVDAFLQAVAKVGGKERHRVWYYTRLIPDLPKSAIPQLEAVIPTLKDGEADRWVDAIQELREKP